MPITHIHRPTDPAAAAALAPQAQVLMPGPRLPDAPWGDATSVVDLRDLALDYVRLAEDGAHLGALTPLQTLVEAPTLRSLAGGLLADAAQLAVGSALRNFATVGGAWLAQDGPPEVLLALLALDAQGVKTTDPASGGELLVEVVLPSLSKNATSAIARVGRTPKDEAIVAAVAVVDRDNHQIRVALAGATPRPTRLHALENALSGQPNAPDRLATALTHLDPLLDPTPDYRGSADYRRAMAKVLVKRAIEETWQKAETH